MKLTKEQRQLAESNLPLVKKVICRYICPNETITGMGYEDLYQEGCFALCRAAIRYDGRAAFATFAGTLIRNHLIDVCRSALARYAHEGTAEDLEAVRDRLENIRGPDQIAEMDFSAREARWLFETMKSGRSAYERTGLDAFWLHTWGVPVSEISRRTGMTPSQIHKRMKAARTLLQQSPEIRRALL